MSYHGPNKTSVHALHPKRGSVGHYLGDSSPPPVLVAPDLGRLGLGAVLPAAQARAAFAATVSKQVSLATLQSRGVNMVLPATTVVNKNSAGQIVVPVSSLWKSWNDSAARLMAPFAVAIKALPTGIVGAQLKSDLQNAPLDALLDIFEPIEDSIGAACDAVIAKKGNVQNYFGTNKNIARVQSSDKLADPDTQKLLKSLRTIEAFVVLFFTQPIELAGACLNEGINIAGDAATAIATTAQNIATAAGQAAAQVIQDGADAAQQVASWFGLGGVRGGLRGLGYGTMRGLGVTGADDAAVGAAATATTAAAGAGAEVSVWTVIGTITALLGSIAGIVTGAAEAAGSAQKVIQPLLPPPKITTKLTPSSSVPIKLGPVNPANLNPSQIPQPPPAASDDMTIPVLAFGGAAVLAFLFLRRR